MKLLRKLQPVASTQFAVVKDESDPANNSHLQLVPIPELNTGKNPKWSGHFHVPRLFKSNQRESPSVFAVPTQRRRKRDALRRAFFHKTEQTWLEPVTDPGKADHDRASLETMCSWEEYDLDGFDVGSDVDDDSFEDGDSGFVFPPVVVPEGYRQQDRMGGVTVAGRRVLFTYAAFKRNELRVAQLRPIPEESVSTNDRLRRGVSTSSESHAWV